MKKFFGSVWEVLKIIVIAAIIVIPIRYFLFQPFLVKGQSMEPNFENGDYLIVDEISYRLREPQRGEVIVFNYPQNPSQRLIKRIIGLPGETVELKDGQIIISKNGVVQPLKETEYLPETIKTFGDGTIVLGQNEYFVLGDNRPFSYDSRKFGLLPKNEIIGRVLLRAWPFTNIDKIKVPQY